MHNETMLYKMWTWEKVVFWTHWFKYSSLFQIWGGNWLENTFHHFIHTHLCIPIQRRTSITYQNFAKLSPSPSSSFSWIGLSYSYFQLMHTWSTWVHCIHGLHECTTYMVYLSALHTWSPWVHCIHSLHECTSYMVSMSTLHTWSPWVKCIWLQT